MTSITLKRSAALLGLVAGLLAAAGPASAQIPPTTTGVTASGGWPDGTPHHTNVTRTGVLDTGYTPPVGSNKGSLTAAR